MESGGFFLGVCCSGCAHRRLVRGGDGKKGEAEQAGQW